MMGIPVVYSEELSALLQTVLGLDGEEKKGDGRYGLCSFLLNSELFG